MQKTQNGLGRINFITSILALAGLDAPLFIYSLFKVPMEAELP
jgi:hypothetical protein